MNAVDSDATLLLCARRLAAALAAAGNQMLAGSGMLLVGADAARLAPVFTALGARVTTVCSPAASAAGAPAAASPSSFDFVLLSAPVALTNSAAPAEATESAGGSLETLRLPAWRDASRLPPVYAVLGPELFVAADFADFVAAYRELAAAFCEGLRAVGFAAALSQQRTALLEFTVPQHAAARLAVLTDLISNFTAAPAVDRIAWAMRGMPATANIASQLGDLSAERILVSLILEPKTAALCLHLKRAGARVAVFASAVESDASVAAALAAAGVRVFAPLPSPDQDTAAQTAPSPVDAAAAADATRAAAALKWGPTLLIDDGSHLIRLAHSSLPESLKTLKGAAEETTSGVRPLIEMQTLGELRLPVIAVNNARTKTLFDNLVGTGESCVLTILRTLDTLATGRSWVVWGYGPVGEGTARAARALGFAVEVIEPDPVRALQAKTAGFHLTTSAHLPEQPFIGVSATGVYHTITRGDVVRAQRTAVWAVAGGIDNEIALDDCAVTGWRFGSPPECVPSTHDKWQPAAHLTPLMAPDASLPGALLIACGGGVNYTAGEGNPLEVMDLSFATQLVALKQLLTDTVRTPGVYQISAAAEAEVAAAALQAAEHRLPPAAHTRPGGAATGWRVHRYRSTAATG